MRILAVAERLDEAPLAVDRAPEATVAATEPVGDHSVVCRGRGEGFARELAASLRADGARARELLENAVVVGGIDDHHDVLVVLRGRANHRRAADVDVLDRLFERAVARGHARERVEVDADEIDRADAVLVELATMGLEVAPRENAAVDLRVQRLDTAVQDLRRACVIAHIDDRHTAVTQRARRAAGREQAHAERAQTARELYEPALVADAEQRSRYGLDQSLSPSKRTLRPVAQSTHRRTTRRPSLATSS